ncbi:helicase-like protein [Homoserinimonas aerilata]|uniref:Helicase-like protein n=1 Tax=Homoserinimonas aerilata TaxID=1162970 RepID=A0A542YFE9_9MICO|nr:DNA methyltransferase [Homoserinimonas aerilata]TQL46694.1 helicase-like protein [Homoserinimonas aerilata]
MSPLALVTGADPTLDYDDFLREKVAFDRRFGFEVADEDLSPVLLPHQRAIVKWAVAGGRRAIFARYGLGKSVMQLETLRLILMRLAGRGLIVAPLGVRGEFIRDGRNLLGIEVRFIRRTEEIDPDWSGIYVTNYESVRDGRLDVDGFTAVSLDEAAVLRSFGSKTYQEFLQLFDSVPFRFVATATPSPNRHKELIHYAGFLGIMDTGAALTRFFHRDSSKAGNLKIYPHKEREFWLWLNTWACFLQKPSDLGFSDDGYDLPPLEVVWDEVPTDMLSDQVDRDGQGVLVRGGALGLTGAAREKRNTLKARVARLMELVAAHVERAPDEQIILWCDLNDEQDLIAQALEAAGITFSSIHGGLPDDEHERRLDEWRDGKTYALIGKPIQLGQGLNLQQSSVSIFVGVTHKFEQTVQAVHRIHRFGQTRPCKVTLLFAESESEVRATLEQKWREHDSLTDTMSDVLREHGLNPTSISSELTRAMGVEREVWSGEEWTVALNDSTVEARDHMAENSVGLIVTSIPFGNHYEYSPNYADFGHTDDNDHFWWQNDYLTPSLLKVLQPGRIMAVHVKDRMLFGSVTGKGRYTVSALHAEAIAHYTQHGFDYYGMITVTTDVVRENNQTYRLSYTKMLKDHGPMGVGSPEYVLLFGKPQTDRTVGWSDERIVKDREAYTVGQWQIDAAAEWRTSGNRLLSLDELAALDPGTRQKVFTEQSTANVYDYDAHVELAGRLAAKNALPGTFASLVPGSWRPDVWTDILRIDTLNSEQKKRDVENHICPFPLEIPRRLINMYSNPGDLVYDPFGGIGSTALCAVQAGRRAYSSELNPASVADSLVYLRRHDARAAIPSLFDLDDEAVA